MVLVCSRVVGVGIAPRIVKKLENTVRPNHHTTVSRDLKQTVDKVKWHNRKYENPGNLLLCHGIMPPYGFVCVLDFFQVVSARRSSCDNSHPNPSQPNRTEPLEFHSRERSIKQRKENERKQTPVLNKRRHAVANARLLKTRRREKRRK
jgi:hypothetical protein